MRPLTPADLNPAILNVQYAVRGELAIKAEEFRDKLQSPGHNLPFTKVISSNIGNPQQKGLDQAPITFTRQVAALMEYPPLIELVSGKWPQDVIDRAKELQTEIGSIGAYSHSKGVPLIRKHVAKFIEERDGYPSDPEDIFLTAGASAGVSLLLNVLITPPTTGILIPIPQYPLYTATLAQFSGIPLPYHLSEPNGWSTSLREIEAALAKAEKEGIKPRALVVINPGNPTGALLDVPTMEALVKLCEEHSLVLLADEVYQTNLHRPTDHPFHSFKQVVRRLGSPVPLVSFHSISKGVKGECGRRGGYFEATNLSNEVRALLYKMPGDASYPLWKSETDTIHAALAHRTQLMAARLNALPGVSCVDSPGALYLYPKLELPDKAVEEAERLGKSPDTLYALELLHETGICVVPGSGFGQKEGEHHYRLTCLCPGVEEYVGALENFHRKFLKKYE
ncbi:putative alanine aminotransferase, mitochondrial [Grifola frondosa]|uniref:Putative alanine aminotransferase, mitochondrial n=1 Tax=Grifola frondosa TaxID=5627 RepID=A0A1C7LPI2_GRIFR|nr:putative alanine aminotransferase, mitochondrial [Grifola frondosa]